MMCTGTTWPQMIFNQSIYSILYKKAVPLSSTTHSQWAESTAEYKDLYSAVVKDLQVQTSCVILDYFNVYCSETTLLVILNKAMSLYQIKM